MLQELVYNSIDNDATCVAVRVNIDRNTKIQVFIILLHDIIFLPETPKKWYRISKFYTLYPGTWTIPCVMHAFLS